jgi:hypothetical protein
VIPTLLLTGLVIGLLVHDLRSLRAGAAAGVVLALAWGIVVGVVAASAVTGVAGTALGAANVAAGAIAGIVLRAIGDGVRRAVPLVGGELSAGTTGSRPVLPRFRRAEAGGEARCRPHGLVPAERAGVGWVDRCRSGAAVATACRARLGRWVRRR